jgi:hypothetical protein
VSHHVDAVIEALKIALEQAENSDEVYWDIQAANRWINQLPGAWFGHWRNLKLRNDPSIATVTRTAFIGHVRATLAYLETNREQIESMRPWSWSVPHRSTSKQDEPIDAEFDEVQHESAKKIEPPKKTIRAIK